MIYVVCAVLTLSLLIATAWAIVSTVYLWKFARIIMGVEDQVEQSLDILDSSYAKISHVLSIPVTSDDQQTRDVIRSIRKSRDAILLIANKISNITSDDQADGRGEE